MNNIERFYGESEGNIETFAKKYLEYLSSVLLSLDRSAIRYFMEALEEARIGNKRIFIAGNGGSAATASHMGSDFGCAFFNGHELELLSTSPFRAQPLTDHVSMITALANDFGYEHIFTKQLEVQYQEGDILIVISASGNSQNLVNAAEWIRARNGKVLGFLGFDGGKLKGLCDVAIVAETPKGEYGPVEDAHMILDHLLTAWMQQTFLKHRSE
jgi:D-sedoheptulose 7-phosphate isomerase